MATEQYPEGRAEELSVDVIPVEANDPVLLQTSDGKWAYKNNKREKVEELTAVGDYDKIVDHVQEKVRKVKKKQVFKGDYDLAVEAIAICIRDGNY